MNKNFHENPKVVDRSSDLRSATALRQPDPGFGRDPLLRSIQLASRDVVLGRHRIQLYRFLTDAIPVVHSCVWTWIRLASAAGEFRVDTNAGTLVQAKAKERLDRLSQTLYAGPTGRRTGMSSLLSDLFTSLFRDGLFGGFLVISPNESSVDQFISVDTTKLRFESSAGTPGLFLESGSTLVDLDRPDFFAIPFGASVDRPFGQSLLQAVPLVAYIEQQLIDDMRRSSHNSGFHRLHVKITPPERMSGESDTGYTNRVNAYFDATVDMIKSCDIDDNPVTWNNVEIGLIGPDKSRDTANSWFMTHRAMVEEICAATNLAPYLLGYSYGATTTWSGFKFDVVMRQVRSVQAHVSQFLEWIGNIDLALAGIDARCRYEFDNTFAYQVKDDVEVQTSRIDNLLKLYQAGLIDQSTAKKETWRIL
jgi:hypothetical protein